MKLYEIHEQIEQLLKLQVDPETGELGPFASAELDKLELAQEVKVLDTAAYIRNLEVEADAVNSEAHRLAKRALRLRKHADWLRGYLQQHLNPGAQYADGRVKIGWRKVSYVQLRDDLLDQLPPEYRRIKVEADKQAIRKALDQGLAIPGAELKTEQRIQIK